MENISIEKIKELDKKALEAVENCDKKLRQIGAQEKTLASLKSEFFVQKIKAEGERRAYALLLKQDKTTGEVEQEKKL